MRTPAWEDGDLLYRPTPYEFGDTHRVQTNGDQTLMTWARPTPWFVVAGAESGPGSGLAKFHHLRDLVDAHDRLWLYQLQPTMSPEQHAWVDQVWRPWSQRWHAVEKAGGFFELDFSISERTLHEVATGLTALREEAAANGVPVPDIGSGRLGFLRDGSDSQRDEGYQRHLRRRPTLTSGLPAGDPYRATSGSIEEFRREARRAVTRPRAFGQAYDDLQALGVLLWHDREWVTPFSSLEQAHAYFEHASGIGVDFDYGAYFDVSDPEHPVLSWERLGQGPSKIAGSIEASLAHPTYDDPRYHVADRGAHMSIPLIGRHGGGFGGGHAHAAPLGPHGHPGHGHPGHHEHGRRFFGGDWGWGGYDDAYGYPWWSYGAPWAAPGGVPEMPEMTLDEEEIEVTSGDYLRHPRRSLLARDDLRGAADVLSPGASGLTCELNLGSDMILRASICVDGHCYQGSADLSRLIHDIHARLHGVDVTEEIVGRGGGPRRRNRHRRRHHHRHHRHQQQDQDQDQGGGGQGSGGGGQQGGGQQQGQGQEQGQGFGGALGAPGYPYPYPYPPQYPYQEPVPAPPPQVTVIAPTVPVAPAAPVAPPVATSDRSGARDHRHRDATADAATATQQAVKASGEILIGRLYDRHCQEVAAGWFDDIKDAFKGVLRKFKGPIALAAQQYVQQYAGDTGGQLAGQLTGSVIDATAGSGDKKQQAQQVMAIAEQAAQTHPKIATAVSTAKAAVAQTAAAYHVTSTALDALRGNPEAQRKLDQLRADAASGDPAAQRAIDLVTLALQSMSSPGDGLASGAAQVGGLLPWLGLAALGGGAYWWWNHRQRAREQARQGAQQAAQEAALHAAAQVIPPPPPSPPTTQGTATTTSGEIESAKADAVAAVQAAWQMNPSIVYYGYVRQRSSGQDDHHDLHSPGRKTLVVQDTSIINPLATLQDLQAWYHEHTADPASYEFVALFDATRPEWPYPVLAHEPPPNPGRVVASAHQADWAH